MYIEEKTSLICNLNAKNVLIYFESKNSFFDFMVSLMILIGKYHIRKSNSKPCLNVFMVDFFSYLYSIQFINSKKSKDTIVFAKKVNLIGK